MLQINLFYKDGKEIEYVVLVKIYFWYYILDYNPLFYIVNKTLIHYM